MQYGTINDITNLKFYTDNGYEIPSQKIYSLTWHFIPGTFASYYMQSDITGYFIGDVDLSDSSNIKILSDSLIAGIIEQGDIMVRFSSKKGTDKNGMPIFEYGKTILSIDYFSYLKKVILNSYNKVVISININGKSYTDTFKINDIFEMSGSIQEYTQYYDVNTIYTGNNLSDDYEYYQVLKLARIDLVKYNQTSKSYIQEVFETAEPSIGRFFPFITYQGSFHQEKISEGFIAADTLMVLEENKDDDGNIYYERPYINADSEYYILFKPTTDNELKVVKKDITYNIEYTDDISFDLSYNTEAESDSIDPLYFTIAFQGDEEGAYQNYLGIYMKSKNNPDIIFYMGLISVKTEVEGEDERFRTLLTNFGIPDPAYYSNIFAEQDYAEEGKDYELINRKSKQLMLTYDQIFSYVGTYKALMNAIKFLGYYDIIFKEWYTLKTTNDSNIDIAVQVFDTSNGEFLKQKLADYGISIEDFRNYNKINKLSMIYHLNEEADEIETVQQKLVHYNPSTGNFEFDSSETYTVVTGVPMTKLIYIYRNTEILVKLIAVKQWLERHVIGVGAYIADITGEGLYFGWQKTQGYQTQHHLTDFSKEQYYTPDVKQIDTFKNSSTNIVCTLNELNNAVTFEDYENTQISEFIRYEHNIQLKSKNDVIGDLSTFIISNTIETPVLGDEYEFDLQLNTNTGTLYEWSNDPSAQILFEQGEIKLLFENTIDSSIAYDSLPYIMLENANIHLAYGDWTDNIKWMIREVIDVCTGNTAYKIKNYKTALNDSYASYNKQYFILEKDPSANPSAYLKYTENTKQGLPMFMIHGYKLKNASVDSSQADNFNLSDGYYILEILKGDILFKNIDNHSVKVKFDNDFLLNSQHESGIFDKEQRIELEYLYHSDRKPFIQYDEEQILSDSSTVFDMDIIVDPIITKSRNDIVSYYTQISDKILECAGLVYGNSTAYQEAVDFINSSIIKEENEYLDNMHDIIEKRIMNEKFVTSCSDNQKANMDISVNVNRIGTYELIGRAYDRYNNVFVSKYDNKINVQAQPIKIDAFTYNNNSSNPSTFYRFNIDGSLLSPAHIQNIINISDEKPKFPKNYQIIDFDQDPSTYSVKFDNMSYCIDTPKNNDFVIFENCVEKCNHAETGSTDESLIIYMIDENPNRINLYSPLTNTLNLVIYDKILMDDISVLPCKLKQYKYINPKNDTDINANSYIEAVFEDTTVAGKAFKLINNNIRYSAYILNTTEYNINNFSISADYDNKMTLFTDKLSYHDYPVFNPEDVIKLRYYRNYSIDTSSFSTVNETSYRITKIYIEDTDGKISDMSMINFDTYNKAKIKNYKYEINGLYNKVLLADSSSCVITRANEYPVHYMTKVMGDGLEYNKNMGYDDYHILQDEFIYNYKHMMLGNYIDDMYGGRIMDYNMDNLKNAWINASSALSDINNIDMYYYHEFPISIYMNKHVMFTHNDINNVFMPGYHTEWKVSANVIDDAENWDEYKYNDAKKILFRNVNELLSFNTEISGPHDIQLTCIDRYGNKVINAGEGRLYVKQ